MHIVERHAGDAVVLDLQGALTVPDGPRGLEAALRSLVSAGRRDIVLNLEHVPAIDAGGVGALVGGHLLSRANGGRMRLWQVPPRIRHMLVIARLADILESSTAVDAGSVSQSPGSRTAPHRTSPSRAKQRAFTAGEAR